MSFPLVGLTAPIAAFVATKGGGRPGPAPRSEKRKRPKRSGGWRKPTIFVRDVKRPAMAATENSRQTAIAGPGPLAARSPSRRPWVRLLSAHKIRNWRSGSMRPEKIPAGVLRGRRIQNDRNRAASSEATCSRKDARSAATPNRLTSSLKSSQHGDNATASIPAVRVRSTNSAIAPSPAGSLSRTI